MKNDTKGEKLDDDITKIKKELDELRRSRDLLSLVIDSLPDPTLVIDLNYHVLFANMTAKRLCGRDPVAEHLCCYKFIHNRDGACDKEFGGVYPCPLQQVISTKKVALVTQIWGEPKNRTFMEITGTPIMDEKGEVIQMVESCHDITRHKQEQDELQRLVMDLRETLVKRRKD